MHPSRSGWQETLSRRHFLLGTMCAGVGAWCGRARANAPATRPSLDFCTREAFDQLDAAWNHGHGDADQNNENGALGWRQSYALLAYLTMYRAHQDTRYLDKLIEQFDQILKQRDSVRRVNDYRGKSLPAWRTAGKYTCGAIDLLDDKRRPVLQVRSTCRPANQISVAVATGTSPGKFKLICTRGGKVRVTDAYDDLTMDPQSEQYAVRRIKSAFGEINGKVDRTTITAIDLRDENARKDDSSGPVPAEAQPLIVQPYIYAVQTGMIVAPIAGFVRTVRASQTLSAQPRYRDKANEFLEAVERAVEIFDYEWREDSATKQGWLVWARGCPNPFDGSDQPHNQYLALGKTMIHLGTIASTEELRRKYRQRSTAMSRTFKSDLKSAANGGLSWTYFWTRGKAYNGWTAADDVSDYQPDFVYGGRHDGYRAVEDTSHAHIDVTFALMSRTDELGIFDDADMKAFGATYARNIFSPDAQGIPLASEYVNGSGKKGVDDNIAAIGVQFDRYEPSLLELIRSNYNAQLHPQAAPQGRLLGTALLNLAARRREGAVG